MSSSPTIDTRFVDAAIRKALLSQDEGTSILGEAQRSGRPASEVMVAKGLITERTRAAISQAVEEDVSAKTVMQGSQFGSESKTNVEVRPDDSHDPLTGPTRPAAAYDDEATLAGDMPERLGKFEVLDLLGQGGMGAVFRGRDEGLGRTVALKVLSPNYASDRSAADRFLREARLSARINHPNVITVHAVGEEDGRLYMALEFLEGGDATALLEKHPDGLPERRALEIARDCARGLVAIERAGLLHRDIKPSNIFITADGDAKLADLGLARTQVGDDRMTQTGAVVGTPCYMAPEQARGASDLDIRTDIYALAASLFRLVTGVVPFTGSSAFVVISNVLNEPAPDPREWRPDLSRPTCDLIAAAMAKDPADRFADAAAFLAAVEQTLTQAPTSERSISGVRVGAGRDRLVSRPPEARTAATRTGQVIPRPPRGSTRPDPDSRTAWSLPGGEAPPARPASGRPPQVVLRTPPPAPSRTPILPLALGAGALVIAVAAFARNTNDPSPQPDPSQVAVATPAPTGSASPRKTRVKPPPRRTDPPRQAPPPPPPPARKTEPPPPPDRPVDRPPRRPPPPRGLPSGFRRSARSALAVQPHARGEGVLLGYRHDFVGVFPGAARWGRATFTDARAGGRRLPRGEQGFEAVKIHYTLRVDADVNCTSEPSWASERGYSAGAQAGFYAHLGVRANNHPLREAKYLGKAAWLTLLFARTPEGTLQVTGIARVSPTTNNGNLAVRRGGVQQVGSLRFPHSPREELDVVLYLNRERWLVRVGSGGKVSKPISGTFADSGLRRGFPRRGYPFVELGNWSDGRGHGSVRTRVTEKLMLTVRGNQVVETPILEKAPTRPNDDRRPPRRPEDGRRPPPPPDGRHPPPPPPPPNGRHPPPHPPGRGGRHPPPRR